MSEVQTAAAFEWREVGGHPPLLLDVYKIDRKLWRIFKPHHYLSGDLHVASHCFGAWIGDDLVAFTSYLNFPHPHTRNIRMGHRLVVLPDYQGFGIGGRLDDWLGQYLWEKDLRYRNVVSHPAMIAYYRRSPRWAMMTKPASGIRNGRTSEKSLAARGFNPRRLNTYSFEYRPPKGS